MRVEHVLTWLAAGLLLLAAGCNDEKDGQKAVPSQNSSVETGRTADSSVTSELQLSSVDPNEPIQLDRRPYQQVHDSAVQAWWHVENAYYILEEKKSQADMLQASDDPNDQARGKEIQAELTKEIEESVFGVNPNVEALFIDAIESEPENPLNMATFGYYLMARKRTDKPMGLNDTISEGLGWVDQAIALWPDEASFYLLKVHILTEQRWAHEWLRTTAMEEVAAYERLDEIRLLFDQAEECYPGNYYINYYRVLTLFRFTPNEELDSIRQEIWREIRKANQKSIGIFSFPPPLRPFEYEFRPPYLRAENIEPAYWDQWVRFGAYNAQEVDRLVGWLSHDIQWPRDKDNYTALTDMLWQLSATKPFYRSFFSFQFKVADLTRRNLDSASDDAAKFTQVIGYLNAQYNEAAQRMWDNGLITDPTAVNLYGLNEVEQQGMHRDNLRRALNGNHAAYLKRAGEILDIDYSIPDDPGTWSD